MFKRFFTRPSRIVCEQEQTFQKPFWLNVARWSDVGRQRTHNEDSSRYVVPKDIQILRQKGALLVLADGMGGHLAGEIASHLAVETISEAYYQEEEEAEASLLYAIKYANAVIYQRSQEHSRQEGMGTTCVAVALHTTQAIIANVGDSRAYLLHHGQIKQVTQDHSWVAEQVRAGILTAEQAHDHAMRSVITRSLGSEEDVQVDLFTEPLEEGDTILLCSDGLSSHIREDEILATIGQHSPQESAYRLVTRANEQGGNDNITVIVARISFQYSPSL